MLVGPWFIAMEAKAKILLLLQLQGSENIQKKITQTQKDDISMELQITGITGILDFFSEP